MNGRSQRIVAGAAAVLVVVLGSLLAWVLLRPQTPSQAEPTGPPVEVRTALEPAAPLFGDPVSAAVEMFVDTRRVDPASVRATLRVAPYRPFARTLTTRRLGQVVVIRLEERLRCIEVACGSQSAIRSFAFPPASVRYRASGGGARIARASWEPLIVHSRLTPDLREHPSLRLGPVRSAPASFRVSPHAAGLALLVLGALLALAGGALLVVLALAALRPRAPRLLPVERILRQLQAEPNGDPTLRRRALEQLAHELAPVDDELSLESRVLAWAPTDPPDDAIDELARRTRARVER